MINFDAVDFSEHRSEEVISFFWRSVYLINHLIFKFMQIHMYDVIRMLSTNILERVCNPLFWIKKKRDDVGFGNHILISLDLC